MAPNSVTLTAAQPRGQLKPRTRGAKQPQCTEMCPADERDQRTVERQLHPYERVEGEYATAPQLAVKKYQRSREYNRCRLCVGGGGRERGGGGTEGEGGGARSFI
jgi:hypothetical protein